MRHRLKGSKLGRTASHRKATLRSLSIALLTHHRIVTTLTKAKELRRHIEPVITRSKEDTTHNRREVFSFIHDNKTVTKLFDEIGPLVADRPGGYTRIIKLGARTGDSADMAIIELVDYNESETTDSGKKKKRTRRAGKSTTKATVAESPSDVTDTTDSQKIEEPTSDVTASAEPVVEEAEVQEEVSSETKVEEADSKVEEEIEASDSADKTEEEQDKDAKK